MREVCAYLGLAAYLAMRRQLVDHMLHEKYRASDIYRTVRFVLSFRGVRGYWPTRAVVRDVLTIVYKVRRA